MKFIEKEESINLECGDFILFGNGSVGVVVNKEGRYGVLYLSSGIFSSDLDFGNLKLLQECLERRYEGVRIIKSKDIEIREV